MTQSEIDHARKHALMLEIDIMRARKHAALAALDDGGLCVYFLELALLALHDTRRKLGMIEEAAA